MADIAYAIFWLLVAITILVFVHELGHFLAARYFKMRVDRFSIGFPPTIFKKKYGETEWAIGATPLGGYVKIAGMVDESMDTDFTEKAPQPWEYRSKPVWQRAIVIGAGVAFNAILSVVVFSVLNMTVGESTPSITEDGMIYVSDSSIAAVDIGLRTGDRLVSIQDTPAEDLDDLLLTDMDQTFLIRAIREDAELLFTVEKDILPRSSSAGDGGILGLGIRNWSTLLGHVEDGMPAQEAGLQPGDRIVSVDSISVSLWFQFTDLIREAGQNPVSVTWERPGSGELLTADIAPQIDENGVNRIGVQVAMNHQRYSPHGAVGKGVADTWNYAGAILTSLGNVITGQESVRESIGGPVMVARLTGEAAQLGMEPFWRIVALLSITLAIINILPIPALDGGHMAFLIYEGIRRREPSLKLRMAFQQVGMALILVLMVFLIFNDLDRIFRFFQ